MLRNATITLTTLLCTGLCIISQADTLTAPTIKLHQSQQYSTSLTFTGRTNSRKVTKLSFEVPGKLEKLAVNDGQTVTKDFPIAQLDIGRRKLRQQELEAQQRSVATQLRLAKKDTKRLHYLYKNNHASEKQYDDEYTKAEKFQADLDRIISQLAIIKRDIKKSTLLSPYSATVLQRFVNEGKYVSAGEPVVELQQRNIDEIYIGIPKDYLHRVPLKSCHTLMVQQKPIKACVTKFLKTVETNSQTVKVLFSVTPETALISGEKATLTLKHLTTHTGFWIPQNALVPGLRGTWQVYALTPTNKEKNTATIKAVSVQVITMQAEKAYITGNLKNGQRIISTGVQKYIPRQVVKITAGQP